MRTKSQQLLGSAMLREVGASQAKLQSHAERIKKAGNALRTTVAVPRPNPHIKYRPRCGFCLVNPTTQLRPRGVLPQLVAQMPAVRKVPRVAAHLGATAIGQQPVAQLPAGIAGRPS